jgi:peroxiredoxin
MKKILLGFFVIFTAFSCTKSGYKINGTVDMAWLNGKTVYLSDLSGVSFLDTDSTTVKNGKFTFSGVADTAKICGIWFYNEKNDEKNSRILILENGKIGIKIVSEDSIFAGGTALNDVYTNYENSLKNFYKKYDNATKISEVATKKVEQEIDDFNFDFCLKNAANLVGKAIFLQSFYNFSVEQKEQITNLFDEKTKKDSKISLVIASLEREKKVAVGQQFSDFALPTPQGATLKLSFLVGKSDYLLIDFWASWCGPCIRYIPALKTIYEKYHGSRFDILSVSLDREKYAWLDAIKKYDLKWHHVSDLKFWQCEAAEIYAISSIPSTILIDKRGKIVGKDLHPVEIEKILETKNKK